MVNNATGVVEQTTDGTDNFLVEAPTAEEINFFDREQSPSTAQWGGTNVSFNITVNTTITDSNLTVFLWNTLDTDGSWTQIGNRTFDNETGGNQNFTFSKLTSSSDIGTNYYKFNATDGVSNTGTSLTYNYEITKDYISMNYSSGNDSTSNRSGEQITLLSFQAINANGSIMTNFPIKYSVKRNQLNYYTDDNFVILTNSSGYANFNFNATCEGEYSGAPKFLVGQQQWKAELNDSLLDYYFQNDTSDFLDTNISVQGDILLEFVTPTGIVNFTQEDTITFLGATTDDCTDALESTVVYNANTTGGGMVCWNTTLVGANAFNCYYDTTTSTTAGWYNMTMYANFSNHYDNQTSKTGTPGLFYLSPLRR